MVEDEDDEDELDEPDDADGTEIDEEVDDEFATSIWDSLSPSSSFEI